MPDTITLATDDELQNPFYFRRLQWKTLKLGIGQRELPTEIQDSMRRADEDGTILQYLPVPFVIPEIDRVFPHERYCRNFMQALTSEHLDADRLINLHVKLVDKTYRDATR